MGSVRPRTGERATDSVDWNSNWARTKAFLLEASGCQKRNCRERDLNVGFSDFYFGLLDFRAFTEHIPSIFTLCTSFYPCSGWEGFWLVHA